MSKFDRGVAELVPKHRSRRKVKGCYECSRRRIDCDRRQPVREKCSQRGLDCSGLGTRYRFHGSLASRGKLAGKQVPDGVLSYTRSDATSTSVKRKKPDGQSNAEPEGQEAERTDTCWDVQPSIDHLDGRARYLLHHFANHIAPGLSVIDRGFNGYRDLILPLSDTDPLVCKAILVVSEQHSSQTGRGAFLISDTYTGLIHDLISRSHQVGLEDQSSTIALLLLHIREIISGGEDFKLLYTSLRTLFPISGANVSQASPLEAFLSAQVFRFQLFAEALLNESHGARFLLTHCEGCLEFLRYCLRLHPDQGDLIATLHKLIKLACRTYVERAMLNPPAHDMIPLIERGKRLAETLDVYTDMIGDYLLGWPYFVMAAESSTACHREFWIQQLYTLHQRTGSRNILKGVQQVWEIWAARSDVRWTSLLGGPTQTLVM
ncbi:hypothetical protein BO71DRAFT_403245 [Aspergillus ellipticus CBS 707.79]|uniref:Zn(2)-C6 fungal-type domain-containing protein n=1 Tax=Aspergillus ellipticus CBS 707.79 TaxID=1448320 RepID=A0A319DDW1_9EURO|nr:hypothetical protein BO71DRAFT_403245 [Aspergillus ellipticus CBS 707.79]